VRLQTLDQVNKYVIQLILDLVMFFRRLNCLFLLLFHLHLITLLLFNTYILPLLLLQ
jgi:hypothetical protein